MRTRKNKKVNNKKIKNKMIFEKEVKINETSEKFKNNIMNYDKQNNT